MTYQNQTTWVEMQKYLPVHNRISESVKPKEEFWFWRNNKIHIDRYLNPAAKNKVIILHGVGGNGRLLSFIGIPLFKQGFEVVALDLPGYGYSEIHEKTIDYSMWVDVVSDLIDAERKKDDRKIILFGLSAGGMLAYHSACANKKVSGLIATNFLDQRIQEVRDSSAINKIMSRLGIYLINFLNQFARNLKLPMKAVANMKAIVNNDDVLRLLINDKTSSGSRVSVRFIHSMLNAQPEIEPEDFNICPVLLVHPEIDEWTDVSLSKLFFDRLKCKKELRMLKNAGHFPIEQPGLQQLEEYLVEFIEKV